MPPVGPPPGATEGAAVGPPSGATEGAPVGPPSGAVEGAPVGAQPSWLQSTWQTAKDLATGADVASRQIPVSIMNYAEKLPVVGKSIQHYEETDPGEQAFRARAAQQLQGTSQQAGSLLWNMAEFAAGEEALKGLSFVQRMKKVLPTLDALEKSPRLAQLIASHPEFATRIAPSLARQATVAGGQTLAHGGTVKEAAESAAATAAGGAVFEGLTAGAGKLLRTIRPTTTNVMGETMPVLASQQPGAAAMTESIAPIQKEMRFAKTQQEVAARAIVNRAQETARNELEKLNAARQARWEAGTREANFAPAAQPETVPPSRQLVSGAAQLPEATATTAPQLEGGTAPTGLARTTEVGPHEGEFPETAAQSTPTTTQPPTTGAPPTRGGRQVSYIEQRPPNFQPIDVDNEVANIRTFGDAADKIREHAAPVFQRFDDVTNGEYTRLRLLRDQGYADGDYRAVRQAEQGIDDLLQNTRGKIDKLDYQTVKSSWRNSKILDAVHDAVNRSFNLDDESLATDANAWRGISGGKLMNGINRLTREYDRAPVEDVIGKDGLVGLTKIASLTQSPQRAALYGERVSDVVHDLAGSGRVGFIPSTLDWTRRLALHNLAVSPDSRFARALEYTVRKRLPSSYATPLLSQIFRMENEPQATAQRKP